MKLSRNLKSFLYSSLAGLYLSGALVWLLRGWFQRDRGYGLEPPASAQYWLKAHGTIGILFFVALGALFQSHIPKGWRSRQRRWTGSTLLGFCLTLSVSVPLLYYLSDETARGYVAKAHTFLGLAAVLPFFVHLLQPRRRHR